MLGELLSGALKCLAATKVKAWFDPPGVDAEANAGIF